MRDPAYEANVARTIGKDRKYQGAQMHAAPMVFAFAPPTTTVGQNQTFNRIGMIYTAEATQFITLIRFSVSMFNAFASALTGFISKVSNTTAISAGGGGDVIIAQAKAINGVQMVAGQEVYPADIEAPINHYLNAQEQLFFGLLSTYNTPAGQMFGPTIFGEAVLKYTISERGFV